MVCSMVRGGGGGNYGVVVWKTAQGPSEGPGRFRVGDRLVAWKTPHAQGPIEDAVDWLWFQRERADPGPSEIRIERAGRTVNLPLPRDRESLLAGPSLTASLRQQVTKALREATASGAASKPAGADVLEPRIGAVEGPASVLWFELELARRALARGGDGSVALPLLRRALKSAEATGDPRARLLVLDARCAALLEAGKPDKAAAACRKTLKEVQIPGGAPMTEVAVRHTLGRALRRLGDLEEAAQEFQRAASLAHRVAPGSLAEAAGLDRLGIVLADLGRIDQARRAAEQGLEIRRRAAPSSLELAGSYHTLGSIALTSGRTDEAEHAYRESLRIRETLPGRPGAYKSLHNLAVIQYRRGHLKEAMRLLARARDQLAQEPAEESVTAMVLNTETVVAMEQGDYRAAEELGEQALEIFSRREPGSVRMAMVLMNLGAIASVQGDLSRARVRYLRALEILRRSAPNGPDVCVAFANLADLDLSEGRYSQAMGRFQGLLVRLKEQGAPPDQLAQVHQNLSFAALKLGRTNEAERECRAALEIRRRMAPGSREEGVSLGLLADIELARNHRERSAALLRRAVRILRAAAPGTVHLAEALHEQGRLLAAEGRRHQAVEIYFQALDAVEKQMERLGATETIRIRFRERYAGWYRELEDLLVEEGEPEQAFDVMERSRARSLLALLSGRKIEIKEDIPRALQEERRALIREWDALLSRLGQADAGARPSLEQRLEDLQTKQDVLRERTRRAAPRLASLYYPAPMHAEDAARLLQPGSAVLAYSVGTEHTLLFVLTSDHRVTVHRIPAGREDLAQAVQLFRGLILGDPRDPARTAALRAASAALGKLLVEPAEARLADVGTVLILPDGPLYLLPFGALSGSGGKRDAFLCERFGIAVEPSLSVLNELRRDAGAAATSRRLVALADPAAQPGGTVSVSRGAVAEEPGAIPGTLEEVAAIARTWGPRSLVLTKGEATEGRLFRVSPSAHLLHIAAHVTLDTVHPLDSTIVLAPDPGSGGGNGLVRGWEIMESLRLPGGLVTLSGCETGLGREWDGEGLIGLTRAFEYAGARAVLSSLWRVDDRSTVFLMDRFYAHLARGLPAAAALRRARNDLVHRPPQRSGLFLRLRRFLGLAQPPARWPPDDPAVWAAFQLHGDPTLAFPAAP